MSGISPRLLGEARQPRPDPALALAAAPGRQRCSLQPRSTRLSSVPGETQGLAGKRVFFTRKVGPWCAQHGLLWCDLPAAGALISAAVIHECT